VGWIELLRVQWRAFVDTAMNLRVRLKSREFLGRASKTLRRGITEIRW
jgi:hypothetical protein